MTLRFPGEFWSKEFHAAHRFPAAAKGITTGSNISGQARNTSFGDKADAGGSEPAASAVCDLSNVYIPEHYEPSYAYPLIVWLVLDDRNDVSLKSLMPQISTQNFLGMKFQAKPDGTGALVAPDSETPVSESCSEQRFFADAENRLRTAVCRIRRNYHIHSERIILAGFDSAATASLELVLRRPEWFGGAIVLGGRFPKMKFPLSRYRDLSGKRVLIGAGTRHSAVPANELVRFGRLLHVAGMDVTTRLYDSPNRLTPHMLAGVNQWMIDGTCTANCV